MVLHIAPSAIVQSMRLIPSRSTAHCLSKGGAELSDKPKTVLNRRRRPRVEQDRPRAGNRPQTYNVSFIILNRMIVLMTLKTGLLEWLWLLQRQDITLLRGTARTKIPTFPNKSILNANSFHIYIFVEYWPLAFNAIRRDEHSK